MDTDTDAQGHNATLACSHIDMERHRVFRSPTTACASRADKYRKADRACIEYSTDTSRAKRERHG